MNHTCPLTSVTLCIKCPVTTCMWNYPKVVSGCMHGNQLIHNDEFLAGAKGLSSLEEDVENAQQRIQSVMVLEAFRVSLLGKETPVPFAIAKTLISLMESNPVFSMGNGWTLSLIYLAVQKEKWKVFKRTLDTDQTHRLTLGLSIKSYNKLQRQLNR